jgi:hypothetical protein
MKTRDAGPSKQDREASCLHGRMLADVKGSDGRPTGELRCMECGTVLPSDPRVGGPSDDSEEPQ